MATIYGNKTSATSIFQTDIKFSQNIKYCIAQNFDRGILTDTYLTENILTDGHCLSPYTCKRCIVFKQFDELNFDGLAGKRQRCQGFPRQNIAPDGTPLRMVFAETFTYMAANHYL